MEQERRKYNREFKLEALRLWQTTDKSAREVEEDLGITHGRLCRWKRKFEEQGEEAFPGLGRVPAADEELRRLQRELEIVKQERDILHMSWRQCPGKNAVALASPSRTQASVIPVY